MKKTFALILVLLLLFSLAACGGKDPETKTTPTPPPATPTSAPDEQEPSEETEEPLGEVIKIGHIVDLTGVESMTGEEARLSLEFAVEWIGGKIGNRPVEIIVGDSQSQPSVAVDVAKKMVEQDGVVAIFGPTQIGHKSAVADYIANAGIPLIFYNPTPARLLGGNEWVIGAAGATPQMPTVMATYLYNELGYRKVHTLAQDNTGGRSFIDPFAETFQALGGTIDQQVWAPVATPDFGPYLVNLGEADALVAWMSGSDAIALWTAWYEMGINEKMPMVTPMHGGFTDYYICDALANTKPEVAEAMLGALAPITYAVTSETPENQDFVDAWIEKFGYLPKGGNLPGGCSQAILLFKTAVEATGLDTSPEKLREAILAADIKGPEGRTYFAEDSHASTRDVYIVKLVKLEDGSYNYEMLKEYNDVPPSGLK